MGKAEPEWREAKRKMAKKPNQKQGRPKKRSKKSRTGMGTGALVASRLGDERIVWGKALPNFV